MNEAHDTIYIYIYASKFTTDPVYLYFSQLKYMYNTGLIPVYNNMAHWNKHDQFSYCNFLFPLCGYVKFFIIFILIRMSTFVIALLYTFHRQLFFIIKINTLYLIINKVSIAAILDLLQTVPLGDIFAENTSVKLFCDSLKASSSDRCFNT